MGKIVDMSAIVAKNEKVRAVGNVKNLNARGDTIDALGRIIQPATDKVNNAYAKTVGNRSANASKPHSRIQPDVPKPAKIDIAELHPEEFELDESIEDDLAIEKIKEEEIKKATKKK
jgi:hypothetical protein